jgi:hypothetical protein
LKWGKDGGLTLATQSGKTYVVSVPKDDAELMRKAHALESKPALASGLQSAGNLRLSALKYHPKVGSYEVVIKNIDDKSSVMKDLQGIAAEYPEMGITEIRSSGSYGVAFSTDLSPAKVQELIARPLKDRSFRVEPR